MMWRGAACADAGGERNETDGNGAAALRRNGGEWMETDGTDPATQWQAEDAGGGKWRG